MTPRARKGAANGRSGRLLALVHYAVGLVAVALGVAVMFTPAADALNRRFALRPRIAPADAIVVLGGGGVRGDGSLGDESLRRTVIGIELYKRGLAPLLLLSGPPAAHGPVEAEARARLAQTCGVPGHAILIETSARTTREEAANIAATLRPRGVRSVLLVVDLQATRRASALFERRGLRVLPAPTEDPAGTTDVPEQRLELVRRLALELTAWSYYRLAGYL